MSRSRTLAEDLLGRNVAPAGAARARSSTRHMHRTVALHGGAQPVLELSPQRARQRTRRVPNCSALAVACTLAVAVRPRGGRRAPAARSSGALATLVAAPPGSAAARRPRGTHGDRRGRGVRESAPKRCGSACRGRAPPSRRSSTDTPAVATLKKDTPHDVHDSQSDESLAAART
jgi:hypothetical protein